MGSISGSEAGFVASAAIWPWPPAKNVDMVKLSKPSILVKRVTMEEEELGQWAKMGK